MINYLDHDQDFGYQSEKNLNEHLDLECLKKNSGTDEQDVDVPSDAWSIFQHLLHTTQQHAKNSLLYVVVAVDAGSQGASQLIKHILRTNRRFFLSRVKWQIVLKLGEHTDQSLTLERLELKFRILAMSSADKLGDTSLLICLMVQAIMMVLIKKSENFIQVH